MIHDCLLKWVIFGALHSEGLIIIFALVISISILMTKYENFS